MLDQKKLGFKDRLAAKLKHAFENKFAPKEFLKYLCPFELTFAIKIFANRNGHDFAILFKSTQEPFIENIKDLESMLSQFEGMRAKDQKKTIDFTVEKIRYNKEIYNCIWLDFIQIDVPFKPQEETNQEKRDHADLEESTDPK